MGLKKIWWDIAKETTRHTNKDLGLSWAWTHPMIPVLLFAIYAVLVWSNISPDAAILEIQQRLLWLIAPLLVYPPWWIARLFRTIPEREQRSTGRIELLHRYLVPRLTFEFLNGGKPVEFEYGETVRTYGGDLDSNISGHERIICGVVRNVSATDDYGVKAQLVEMVGNNGKSLREPINFRWVPVDGHVNHADVAPGAACTVKMFRRAKRGFYFERDDLPLEYRHFFDDGTVFTGKLNIGSFNRGSLTVHFHLELDGEPRLTVVQCVPSLQDPPEYYEGILAGMEQDDARRHAKAL